MAQSLKFIPTRITNPTISFKNGALRGANKKKGNKTMKYINKIEEILNKDYDQETPDKPRSADFNRAIKSMLKNMFPGCTIQPTKGAWCEASGFIQNPNNGKTVFYIFRDYRMGDWKKRILYRQTAGLHDSCGGANCYTDIERMQADVMRML